MRAAAASSKKTGVSESRKAVIAASVGTVFEWYDFFIYAALTSILARQFFPGAPATTGFIFTLIAFAVGFAVRPIGALIFGWIGDTAGRRFSLLSTLALMGVSTFLIGLIPSFSTWGPAAPAALVGLRVLQGLALGGEYGGASLYVAELAPPERRGLHTSWIQATGPLGLLIATGLNLVLRLYLGEAAFADWGWRIPFLFSAVLVTLSLWIRLRLYESPVFLRLKMTGQLSAKPLRESFCEWRNLKIVLLALFGVIAGAAVIAYGGEFLGVFFLIQTAKVEPATANLLMAAALLIGLPFMVLFGWLSDLIGRKPLVLAGLLLSVVTYFPIFQGLLHFANPALESALQSAPVVLIADPADCSLQVRPSDLATYSTTCNVAKGALVNRSVNYENEAAPPGTPASVRIGDERVDSFDARGMSTEAFASRAEQFKALIADAILRHGYPTHADPGRINYVATTLLLTVLAIYAGMVYAPLAALLVELFPARIRFSSVSLPYHIGFGWIGGFLPAMVFGIVAATGDIFSGLWCPVLLAASSFSIALIFLPETRGRDLNLVPAGGGFAGAIARPSIGQ